MVNFQLRRSGGSPLAFFAITFLAFVTLAKSAAVSSEDEAFRNFLGDYRALVNPENLFWVPHQPNDLVSLLKRSDKKSVQDEHLIRLLRKRSYNPDHGHRRLATRAAWPADAGTMIRVLKRNGNEVAEPQDNMEWQRLLELMAAEQNQANGQMSEYSHKFPLKLGKRTPPLLRQFRAANSPMYIRSS